VGVLATDRSDRADRWFEVAKAGLEVVAVGVAGGALAAAWRGLTARREAAAATKDKIRAEFTDLIVLYNGVKSVRRALRSLGLDAKLHLDKHTYQDKDEDYFDTREGLDELEKVGRAVQLTKKQADGFHEQMEVLNTLQLGYEAKARQFDQADLLEEETDAVADTLTSIENYLNKLVDLWEENGWKVHEGTKLHEVSSELQPLFRQAQFKPKFSEPMKDITAVINKHLFGAPAEAVPARASAPITPSAGSAPQSH